MAIGTFASTFMEEQAKGKNPISAMITATKATIPKINADSEKRQEAVWTAIEAMGKNHPWVPIIRAMRGGPAGAQATPAGPVVHSTDTPMAQIIHSKRSQAIAQGAEAQAKAATPPAAVVHSTDTPQAQIIGPRHPVAQGAKAMGAKAPTPQVPQRTGSPAPIVAVAVNVPKQEAPKHTFNFNATVNVPPGADGKAISESLVEAFRNQAETFAGILARTGAMTNRGSFAHG
jgi:hypothetical protein